ncbi:MAG: HAD family phosphatase [Anaerolineae bacterium]|nr:HAD family phosphatase [Anaerolineae bacterium]
MPLPEAIIFDYGRVLVGPIDDDAFDANLTRLARGYGFDQGTDLWNHIYLSQGWEDAKRGRLSHADFWAERLAALGIMTFEDRAAFKSRLFAYWGLMPGMDALLRELQPVCRLAVLSNTSRQGFAGYLVQRRGFGGLFDKVISSAEVGFAKPEPEIYQIALDRLHIQPKQALFIDDLKRNTDAAETLGIPSIVFTTADALREDLKNRGILSA